jgi:hypothetical protein
MRITYVNGLPGSGKTTYYCDRLRYKVAEGKKFIIAVPTVALMVDIVSKLEEHCIPYFNISSERGKNVQHSIDSAISLDTSVILITHISLMSIPKTTLLKCSDYNLIIDEVFNPAEFRSLKLKRFVSETGLYTKMLNHSQFFDTGLVRLSIKDRPEFKSLLKEYDSDRAIEYESTKDLLRNIADPTKIVLIRKYDANDGRNHALCTLYNVHCFSYFKNVRVYSAFFEHTALYHVCSLFYDMVDRTEQCNLRSIEHRHSKLSLYPLFQCSDNARPYSKFMRDTSVFVHNKHLDYVIGCLTRHEPMPYKYALRFNQYRDLIVLKSARFEDEDFLTVNNNDDEGTSIGKRISSRSHGLNSYSDYTHICYLAAFNPKPYVNAFFKVLLPNYDVWIEQNVLTCIQNIFRTDIRNINSNSVICAVVSDSVIAESVKDLLLRKPRICAHDYMYDYSIVCELDYSRKIDLPDDYTLETHKTNGKLRKHPKVILPPDYHPSTHFSNGKRKLTKEEKRLKKKLLNAQRSKVSM